MGKRVIVGCFIVLMLTPISVAAVPSGAGKASITTTTAFQMEWNRTFGGIEGDSASSLIRTTDGGFVLAGETDSYGTGNFDFWLVKTNSSGYAEWNSTFGGAEWDVANSVIQTADGGYALAGHSGYPDPNFWLVKTDASGQHEWNSTIVGGIKWDGANSVIQTADGGFALAGYNGSFPEGDMWLVKTDASGQHVWNTTFGGPEWERADSVIQTADGGFALAGETGTDPLSDFWLVKTDASGQHEWNKTYDGGALDSAKSMIQTADGGFALAGEAAGETGTDPVSDFWLVKTDASGQHEWNKTYDGGMLDAARSVIQTADGGFALAGHTYSHDVAGGNIDIWLVKTDANGQMEWAKTFGGPADDAANSVVQTPDGAIVLAGETESYGAGATDMWLIKIIESETTTTTTPTEASPSWTPIISIFSLMALVIFRKRIRHR
ncbi:MAG: hypothetical protein ACFFGZ_16750 [Candidatus Thorarchaeota archaeon]